MPILIGPEVVVEVEIFIARAQFEFPKSADGEGKWLLVSFGMGSEQVAKGFDFVRAEGDKVEKSVARIGARGEFRERTDAFGVESFDEKEIATNRVAIDAQVPPA